MLQAPRAMTSSAADVGVRKAGQESGSFVA
jgi:hypothetical protein